MESLRSPHSSALAAHMDTHRARVVEVLQVVASKSEQYDYYMGENISIPDTLLAQWEEIYRQNDKSFEDGFSERELHDLNCFYDFLLARMGTFPKNNFEDLMKDMYWDSVCRLASELLKKLSDNSEVAS